MSKKQSLDSPLEVLKSHSIGVVERDTGIGRDTLRIWQRRYGFPNPIRNHKGERCYPDSQILRLQRIRRLLDQGLRPGMIVPLNDVALRQFEAEFMATHNVEPQENIGALIACLRAHDATGFESLLQETLATQGLRPLVLDTLAPLLKAVGEDWARGQLDIYAEHFMSQLLIRFLSAQIAKLEIAATPNPVLLGTLPGERHGLGLLMTSVILANEGVASINLGVEVPMDQLVRAAERFNASVVGLTFSGSYSYGAVHPHLRELRERLPAATGIWAGGHAMLRIRKLASGIVKIKSLAELPVSAIIGN